MPTRSMPISAPTASSTSRDEAQPVVDRAAIFVGAEVGAVAQELVDQIAIGAMELDAVEAGGDRVAGGAGIILR